MVTLEGNEPRAELEESLKFYRVAQLEGGSRDDLKRYAEDIDALLDAWLAAPA